MPHASWLPPLAWMAAILAMSSDVGSAELTGSILRPLVAAVLPGASPMQVDAIHFGLRKAGHLAAYGLLALLWLRPLLRAGLPSRGWAAAAAAALAVAWAAVDEAHQATLASRTGTASDVLVDGVGAVVAAGVAGAGWRRALGLATAVLLWVAAVGGAAALALDLAVGARPGVLWMTAPAAALILAVRRRRPRRNDASPARPPSPAPVGSRRAAGPGRLRP
jgi:VanZ family protein